MNQEQQQSVREATNRDGLASVAIMLLAIALVVFAAVQIIS